MGESFEVFVFWIAWLINVWFLLFFQHEQDKCNDNLSGNEPNILSSKRTESVDIS